MAVKRIFYSRMSAQPKVINLTTGWKIKRSQANRRIEQCISAWVEEGRTIRDLSVTEMIAARSEQSRFRAPIAMAEIPGLRVEGITQDFHLIHEANQYASQACQ